MKRFLNVIENILAPLVWVITYGIIAILCVSFIGLFIDFDRIRHNIAEKRNPVSQEQIIQALDFEYDRNTPQKEEVYTALSKLMPLLDSESLSVFDSLLVDYNNNHNFDSCVEIYRITADLKFPEPIQTYFLNQSFALAETKYETIWPILFTYKANNDYEGIIAVYDLVRKWKWDIEQLVMGRDYNHEYDFSFHNAIRGCMEYGIMALEELCQPVDDSTAETIIKLCNTGLDASSQLFYDGSFHPVAHFFADRRAQYAYQLNDPKADEYADYYIKRTQRGLFINHYLITDRGSNVPGYQDRFFSDPLFLRYKSCLKKKEYKKARELLDIIQSYATDDYQDPINPFYFLHDSIQFSTRQLIDIALPYSKYDLATISENARLRFLTHKDDFGEWSNGSFLTGVLYLSPTEGYSEKTIDYLFNESLIQGHELSSYMVVNYNNSDARWVYNTALFIKGATTKISQAVERAIVNTGESSLIDGIKDIKREHVFTSQLDKKAERYVAINDSVETLLGAKMKKALSDCFYSFTDIKSSLSKNECAIEIVKAPSLSFGDDVYKAVLLRSDWEEPKLITLTSSANVNDYYIAGNYYSSTSSKLYTYVWKPLEKYLSPQDVIYIAPDGVLSLVNFGAILNDKGECLSDIYNLHQCISTKSIKDREQEQEVKSVALFGGMNYDEIADAPSITYSTSLYRSPDDRPSNSVFEPLSGTQKEIEEIQAKAESNGIYSRSFSGKEGTEYNFKDLTGSSESIIHVATHGFYYSSASTKDLDFFEMIFVDDNPYDRCGLVFSGGNIAWRGEHIPDYMEDGILLGSEIARMDLSSTDLVVLSACNTGLGDIGKEGVAGLQMAFKQAGVESMLMTLGKVDDEATAYFMTNFYERLFSGKDKYSAYHAAINAMRESERFSDPKYWSQFILID